MNKNKVSIALATYNGSAFIEKQLNSFLKQTVLPYELVVVDDCSTDDTVNLLKKFKAKAPFKVSIIENEINLGSASLHGYGQTFSKAAENCDGDIIFFSDQDDVWFKNKIETHLKIYENNKNIKYIINDYNKVNYDLTETIKEANHYKDEITGLPLIGCCCSGKKEFIKSFLPVPLNVAHDWWFHICADLIDGYHICKECLQLYRTHDKQTSKYTEARKKGVFEKLVESLKKDFFNKELEIIKKDKYDFWHPRFEALTEKEALYNKEKLSRYLSLIHSRFYCVEMRFMIRNKTLFNRFGLVFKHFNDTYLHDEKYFFRAVKTAVRDLISPIFITKNDCFITLK